MGLEFSFIDMADGAKVEAAIKPNTKMIWVETPTNPTLKIVDLPRLLAAGRDRGAITVVDNTFATPYLQQPITLGADIVLHSATKFIGGHGTSIGGAIVDSGKFDWAANAERFPMLNQPDPSYHGLAYWPALGNGSFILKARVQLLRDVGMAISPFNAFMFLQGLETLSLRMERHWQNAQAVAEFLDGHAQVESVNYAGLASSPWHERATELGATAIVIGSSGRSGSSSFCIAIRCQCRRLRVDRGTGRFGRGGLRYGPRRRRLAGTQGGIFKQHQ